MKKKKEVLMSCPYCGRIIGKTNSTEMTALYCPQCNRLLEIKYRHNVYTVREAEEDYIAQYNTEQQLEADIKLGDKRELS